MLDSLGGKCRRQNSEFRRQKSEVQEFRSSGVQEPRTRIEDCGFCAVRTSERQPPNPELRTPNAKLRTPNPELRTPNSELHTPNSKLQTPSSKLQTTSTSPK